MCDKEVAKSIFDKCKLDECRKAVKFFTDDLCQTRRQTLDIIDNVPKGWSGLYKTVRSFLKDSKSLFKGFVFQDEIEVLIDNGYINALKGNLHSAEESNRFLMERIFLSIFIENTTRDYEEILQRRLWHKMVDSGYTILHFGEVMGRLKKATGGKPPLNEETIYLVGKPVCRKHLEYPQFSRHIEDLPIQERLKCRCGKDADYMTLAMPKVSALIGIGCYILGYPSERFENIYSNISRIIHPYGLVKVEKSKAVLLWFRDYFMIVSELEKAIQSKGNKQTDFQEKERKDEKIEKKKKKGRKNNPKKRNRKR
ncbi:hypothetical protein IC006_2645 [Sulfuracidifex tepidarius]|uniref:Uncharacterized protein n=1 Tax=Sulfuracidifex tepidarius TaxID=1294262 RepID=A0A510DZD8_9CREN|nr:hypothetical protein [Sulfuracidifex tepidarius]BBG25310.1 hypothetical protein IC006_2645 [Sulfuracidifex tepidarius]